MNKKKLYIHIGTQKTGSTTIQDVLAESRSKLLEENICYLGRFAKISRNLRVIKKFDPVLVEKFQEKVKTRVANFNGRNPHTFVTSNEKFTGNKMIAYRNSGVIAESLKKIFEPFSFDIKIIVYLRRQDKFIESTYAQKVYSGSSLTFREFIEQFDEKDFHWTDLLDSYADVFGKKNILPQRFDKKYLPQKNSLINNFGDVIGSEYLKTYSQTVYKNRGYSRDTLELARLTNQYLEKKEMRQLRDIFRKADPKKRSYFFFNSEERRNFLANYESSNHKLATDYFLDQSGELFSIPEYTQDTKDSFYEGLNTEQAAVILSKSLLLINQNMTKEIEKLKKESTFEKMIKKIYCKLRNLTL